MDGRLGDGCIENSVCSGGGHITIVGYGSHHFPVIGGSGGAVLRGGVCEWWWTHHRR